MKKYDLIVIGSGAGLIVLAEGLQHGLKCALIENGKFGGTCLTRGCIPSKVLTYAADVIRLAEHSREIGLNLKMEKPDWKLIRQRVWSQIDESKEIEAQLSDIPLLDIYKGTGEFTGKNIMAVRLQDGSYTEEFKGQKILIASGSRSIIPSIEGLEETGYITTENFFGDKFPDKPWESLILVGGGIIAVEFAHIFSALGTKVTIVEINNRLVSGEEFEISDFLKSNFLKIMKVYTSHKPISAQIKNGMKSLNVQDTISGKIIDIDAEELFVCAGRRPNSDLLKLENCGIETYGSGWIKTNQYLETNVKGIWAIGDSNGLFQFRHKANTEADICRKNLFGNAGKKAMDYSAVPWVIYTNPQIAHVGITEREALDKGYQIYRAVKHYSSVAKGFAMGYEEGQYDDGFVKMILDKSLRFLGVHIAGPHADMLIQPFVYLMNSGFTCSNAAAGKISQNRNNKTEKNVAFIKNNYACPGAGSALPVINSMIVHPSLNEVTGWVLDSLEPVNISVSHTHTNSTRENIKAG